MANNIKYGAGGREATLDGIVAAIGSGGTLTIYDTTAGQPADPDSAVPGAAVALAVFAFANPSHTVSDDLTVATATIPGQLSDTCLATGTADWFRIVNSGGDKIMDGSVGLSSGTFDIEFDTISWTLGNTINLDGFTLTAAET